MNKSGGGRGLDIGEIFWRYLWTAPEEIYVDIMMVYWFRVAAEICLCLVPTLLPIFHPGTTGWKKYWISFLECNKIDQGFRIYIRLAWPLRLFFKEAHAQKCLTFWQEYSSHQFENAQLSLLIPGPVNRIHRSHVRYYPWITYKGVSLEAFLFLDICKRFIPF